MPASRYPTPELDALKNTIRQIVKDECLPLESEYLTHPPEEGVDDGGREAPRPQLRPGQEWREHRPLMEAQAVSMV